MATENCSQNVNHWRMLPLKVCTSSLGSFTILASTGTVEADLAADAGGSAVYLRMLRPLSNSSLSMTIDFKSIRFSRGAFTQNIVLNIG